MAILARVLLLLAFATSAYAQTDDLEAARQAMRDAQWSQAISLLSEHLERDTEDLEARYLRAICYGERGKNPTLKSRILRLLATGAEDFEFVLARDSLFQDALFQYAVLRRNAGDLKEAINLGEAQLKRKPDLDYALAGLIRFYQRYTMETEPAEARRWLQQQRGAFAPLFVGRTYERQSFFRAANTTYAALLEGDLPRATVLMALAQLHFAWSKPETGTAYAQDAIAAISSRADALLMFDYVKTIVSPMESADFDRIADVAKYQRFFTIFWTKRDPMPAAPYNARMAEHFRRLRVAERHYLFHGFRAWYRSPFTHDARYFPASYALSSDYDDRGVIFIRHGEPDDYTMGEAQSWLYEDSLLVYHFAPTCINTICSVTRHFVPVPQGGTFSPSLVGLDGLDAERKSSRYIAAGLTTDRHRWPERTRQLEVPYVIAAFRGLGSRALVEVYYGIPTRDLTREGIDTVAVEVGLLLHDQHWGRKSFVRETKHLSSSDAQAPYVDRFQIDLSNDVYRVSLHARSLQTPHLSAHAFEYRPPRFDLPGLKLSDILLADSVLDLHGGQTRDRGDLYVHVNPSGLFSLDQPLFAYFEIYDLTLSPEDRARYSVSYTLTPTGRKGEEQGAISLQVMEQQGSLSSTIEYVGIDVSDVDPGSYNLRVTVRDERTGAEAARTRALALQE